jgi:hypothetical protein
LYRFGGLVIRAGRANRVVVFDDIVYCERDL